MRNKVTGAAPADGPQFVVRPPLRCYHRLADRPGLICAELAVRFRPECNGDEGAFFCAAHARPTDTAIPDAAAFRRVSVMLEVCFSGVSLLEAVAHAEALDRLERAVAAAGGVINLHACRSVVGRLARHAQPGAAADATGDSYPRPLKPLGRLGHSGGSDWRRGVLNEPESECPANPIGFDPVEDSGRRRCAVCGAALDNAMRRACPGECRQAHKVRLQKIRRGRRHR